MKDIKQYIPCEDEEYMNQKQIQYFKDLLLQRRRELFCKSDVTKNTLKDQDLNAPDIFDVASKNIDLALDFEVIERNRQSLILIDKALAKINSGEYGFCELTGEEIGVKRLTAQPTATLCIEAKEMLERQVHVKGYSATGYANVV